VNDSLASGASILSGSLNAAALALRPFTVVRTHLELMLRSDQAAALERQLVGIGMAIVSDQAVAIGVTAVPTPITDLGSDLWFVHQLMYCDESGLTDRSKDACQMSVDSKAMRRVEEGQDLIITVEASSISDGAILTSGGRILLKLH